jgi:translocation and assembly module TamB
MPIKPTEPTSPVPKRHRWMRWLKHLFVTLHFLLLSTILILSAVLYVAFRPDGLEIVNTYLLKPLGIHYVTAEGSLLEGFTLYDLHTDHTAAKKLTLTYRLDNILKGEHVIDKIVIDGLQIHLDDFINNEEVSWPLPMFTLKEVIFTNLQLISSYPIELDLTGQNGSYDGDKLNFASISATIKSRYASGAIKGSLTDNTIKGTALIYPNAKELNPYSGRFTTLPSPQIIHIDELSDTRAKLTATIDKLDSKQANLISAHAVHLTMDYRYENDFIDFDALYTLARESDTMRTKQHLRYSFEGKTTTYFEGNITSTKPLPAYTLHGEFSDDAKGVKGHIALDKTMLDLASNDYDRFQWSFKTDHPDLRFLSTLPSELQSSPLKAQAQGSYVLSTDTLQGSLQLIHNDGIFEGAISSLEGRYQAEGTLTLPKEAPLWKNWRRKPPEKLTLALVHDANTTHVNLAGETLALQASLKDHTIKGSGEYLGTFFDLQGSLANSISLDIQTATPSLFKTLSDIEPMALHKGEYYDAEISTKTHLTWGDTLQAHTDITIPWYAAVLDSKRAYAGVENTISLTYDNGRILIERYRFSVADHPVTSDKRSTLHLNEEGDLIIDDLWIYDSLRLHGIVSSRDLSASLRLTSDRFSYEGPDGRAHLAADITFTRDTNAVQKLEGSLKILDATITYLPLQQFKVMDDDIIIIQDVRAPSTANLSMNLHVTSEQPIHYLTKELDVVMNADVTLWKDPYGPIQLLGMIKIPEGSAKTGGKFFEIQPSEIYFGGQVPLNPYLNISVLHKIDYKKILIYITHTLDSPIFLFSSDPVMSQNDIMSYILFGTPANTSVTGDAGTSTIRADATNFMLGAGIKGLINGATKLQIDTMNILTTKEGGMGFEIGAKINKDLRVLYKNDTVSSVSIQYSVNRWLRLDADVHELGQGINAIYVKDFRDILPHNEPKKK